MPTQTRSLGNNHTATTTRRKTLQNCSSICLMLSFILTVEQFIALHNVHNSVHNGHYTNTATKEFQKEARIRIENNTSFVGKTPPPVVVSFLPKEIPASILEKSPPAAAASASIVEIKEAEVDNFIPSPTLTVHNALSHLPVWVKTYIKWHKLQRLHHLHENTTKFLIIRCLKDDTCNGLSDRLRPLPYYLRAAYESRRVLLIHWEKPFALQHFLLPPANGLDWTVPDGLISRQELERDPLIGRCAIRSRMLCMKTLLNATQHVRVLPTLVRFNPFVNPEYRRLFRTRESPAGNFGEIVRVFFDLVPDLKALMYTSMKKLGLMPGRYVTAHARTKYPKFNLSLDSNEERSLVDIDYNGSLPFRGYYKEHAIRLATHAIHCASNLVPGLPVYLASDSNETVSYMIHDSTFAGASSPIRVIGKESTLEPIHFDTKELDGLRPSDFYTSFIDLWIIAHSRAVAFGVGNYGRLGFWMSGSTKI